MQSARTPLSPSKQNNLPSARDLTIRQENGQINQILTYLKEKGIKLPSHLLFTKNTQDFSLKLKPIGGSTKNISEVNSLKIKLSETQFELKKIEQDFAQYKRSVKLEKQKQTKKFEEIIERLKNDSKQNNQDYEFTLQRKQKQHSEKIEKLRDQYTKKLQKLEKQLTLKHSMELSNLKNQAAYQKENKQIEFSNKYQNLHKKLTDQIQNLKTNFQHQKHNINQRNREKQDQSQKKYQSTYLALQSQKKTQQKLHEKTKIDAQRQKQKLFGEFCYERNVRKNLQDQLIAKNKEIKELNQKIQQIKIQLNLAKENSEQEKLWIKKQHEKEIENIHEQYTAKISNLLQSHNNSCEKYEAKIQRLNVLQMQSKDLHLQQLNDLSSKFQQRLSKKEDLDEIKRLVDTLLRKDQQIKKLTRELKYRNLEIQNKQEVYNKIFKNSARVRQQRKGLISINKCEYPTPKLQRDAWSKESLFRKSQTADVKNLLNNISKSKRQRTSTKQQ